MKSNFKRALSFLIVFCLLFTTLWTVAIVASAEGEVWEQTYYGTPNDYYAGGAKTISVTDSSFADWAGQDLIEVDSLAHPENWQNPATRVGEIKFRYALAWDATNLYYYIEIDAPMTALETATAPRLFIDITPATIARTGLVDFGYDATAGKMICKRADKFGGNATTNAEFKASVGVNSAEVAGITYLEASIPWAGMGEAFTPQDNATIKFNTGVLTTTSVTSLYADNAYEWGTTNAPWQNNVEYLTMHFATGTAVLPVVTPKALVTTAVQTVDFEETNMALGKTYTGTAGTRAGWIDPGTILTNGVYGTFETISGTVFAGWQGGGIGANAGTLTPNVEADGKIVKIIDLGSAVSGMHKFVASSAQVAIFGIIFPEDVTFYASTNGVHYQLLGSGAIQNYVSGLNGGQTKETQDYVVTLATGVTARYIKAVITPPEVDYVITPIGEIAAIKNIDAQPRPVPIGNPNAYWLSAEMAATDNGIGGTYAVGQLANIYTVPNVTVASIMPGYNNWLNWWTVGVFEWDAAFGAYKLTAKYGAADGSGLAKGLLVVPANGFILATNGGMNAINAGHTLFTAQSVGIYAYLHGPATHGQNLATIAPHTNLIGKMTLSLQTKVPNAYNPLAPKFDGVVGDNTAFSGTNLAQGKSYTTSVLGTNVLKQVGYGGNYLDDGVKLTSGTVSSAYNVDTVGFYRSKTGIIQVDLAEAGTLSGFKVAFWQQTGYGIAGPNGITVEVSNDGVNWTYLGAMQHTKAEGLTYATMALPKTITAQYIKYSVDCNDEVFVFASEVFAYEVNNFTQIDIDFTTTWAVGTAILTNSVIGQSMTLGELTGKDYYYWNLAVCEWSEAQNAYIVTTKYSTFANHSNVAIPVGGFVLAVHSADSSFAAFALLQQGYKVYLYNVDPLFAQPGDTFTDAYFTFPAPIDGAVPVTPAAKVDITHNNAFLAGIITLMTRVEGNAATTIGEISAIYEGSPEDYNYFYLAVVEWSSTNVRYEITAKYDILGRPAGDKTDVVVPANGFVIAINGVAPNASALNATMTVGTAVYLYTDETDFAIIDSGARDTLANTSFTVGKYTATERYYVPPANMTAINNAINQISGLVASDYTEESWADFMAALEAYYIALGGTFAVSGGPGEFVTGVANNSDPDEVTVGDLTLLYNGNKVSNAGDWGTFTGAVLLGNKVCTDETLNPTVSLVLTLDQVRTIDKVILDFYHCYNVMVGLPKNNEVRLSYSVDGITYTDLGTFTFVGAPAAGTFGVIEATFDIGVVDARYIGVEFDFGPSPFGPPHPDGKVVWEWMSLTEVAVAEVVVVEPMTIQKLVDLIGENGFNAEQQTILEDAALDIIVAKGNLELSVILGDLDGDGEFTANDIILSLQSNAGLITLASEQMAAFDVDGNGLAEANDIILMLQMNAGIITVWPANIV
ncbi:MAG: hypothetical protein CVU97_03430 [Firmicutes bacterium HGW-Firmicutes-21]|nr:MAG: hypothetical protein CVU97_03430 [Firmicutes bacterium HGW-Firmicutes-21]